MEGTWCTPRRPIRIGADEWAHHVPTERIDPRNYNHIVYCRTFVLAVEHVFWERDWESPKYAGKKTRMPIQDRVTPHSTSVSLWDIKRRVPGDERDNSFWQW